MCTNSWHPLLSVPKQSGHHSFAKKAPHGPWLSGARLLWVWWSFFPLFVLGWVGGWAPSCRGRAPLATNSPGAYQQFHQHIKTSANLQSSPECLLSWVVNSCPAASPPPLPPPVILEATITNTSPCPLTSLSYYSELWVSLAQPLLLS